jgi:hypothetical protein
MASCYAQTARRASYVSPPHFPGGTVARGTPAEKMDGAPGETPVPPSSLNLGKAQ